MNAQNPNQLNKVVGQLIAKAWIDNEFQQRFMANTAEVLREAGLMLDEAIKVAVVQSPAEAPGLRLVATGGYEINLPPLPADLGREHLCSSAAKDNPQNPHFSQFCCCQGFSRPPSVPPTFG